MEVPKYRVVILKMADILESPIIPLSLIACTYVVLPESRNKPLNVL
jgi:hypothetical protein